VSPARGDLPERQDVSIALAQRYSQAYADLDTASALAEIVG
jgi:hypothetical protein